MDWIGNNVEVAYLGSFNCTVCKCHACNKWWTYQGGPGEMTVGEMSLLLEHDREHSEFYIAKITWR